MFFNEYAGNQDAACFYIRNIIVDRILQLMTDIFATAGFSYAEIDKTAWSSAKVQQAVAPEFLPLASKCQISE